MELLEYLEKTYNDCNNPCCIFDYHTDELVFLNQTFIKKFQIFEPFFGRNAKDFFKGILNESDFPEKDTVHEGDYIEKRIYSKSLKSHFRANTTVIIMKERKLLLTKYFMTSLDQKRVEAETNFSAAMEECLKILELPQQEESIEELLKLLSQFYSSEYAFICEFNPENHQLSRKYLCNNTDQPLSPDEETRLVTASEKIGKWLENHHDHSTFIIEHWEENTNLESIHKKIIEKYDIHNMTLNKLWNKDGTILGVVGLCNRTYSMYDERLLKAVSHFVVERFHTESSKEALTALNGIDLLTGFFNRSKYTEVVAELHKNPPKSLGVVFVNLNGLRKTNEYFGFEVGDVQIKKTSETLREHFSEDFYRISGDEFVGFIYDCEKAEFNEQIDALHLELKSANSEANFSIGHSWETGSYHVSNQIKIADTVMMVNKQAYYFTTIHESAEVLDTILSDLFRALAEDEFLIYLQPQVNLDTQEVVGAEALVRRFDRKYQKMIFPDTFIPLYERNSIIRHVDLFVIRRVCQILMDWTRHQQAMPISVNLSRVTLMEHGIVKTITDILDEYSIPHHLIVIEITERIGVVECEVTTALVDEFKEQGFRLSLDDFGCAYSNIVTLSQIEVDEVKIDKSLVDNLISNSKNRVIVKNMLLMCNELENTFSLAEGIETEEQAEFLRSVHCHLGQGFLYSRPLPNEEFFQKYIKNTDE